MNNCCQIIAFKHINQLACLCGVDEICIVDNLQRKYGELSGEIVVVEITVKDIQEILASNARNSIPISTFQKPSSSPRVLKSLGISLCGNKDLNQMAVLVCGLRPGSIAEVDGRIAVGDQLLEVIIYNGFLLVFNLTFFLFILPF